MTKLLHVNATAFTIVFVLSFCLQALTAIRPLAPRAEAAVQAPAGAFLLAKSDKEKKEKPEKKEKKKKTPPVASELAPIVLFTLGFFSLILGLTMQRRQET